MKKAAETYRKICNEIFEKHFDAILREMQEKAKESDIEKEGYVVDGYPDVFLAMDDFRETWYQETFKEELEPIMV